MPNVESADPTRNWHSSSEAMPLKTRRVMSATGTRLSQQKRWVRAANGTFLVSSPTLPPGWNHRRNSKAFAASAPGCPDAGVPRGRIRSPALLNTSRVTRWFEADGPMSDTRGTLKFDVLMRAWYLPAPVQFASLAYGIL